MTYHAPKNVEHKKAGTLPTTSDMNELATKGQDDATRPSPAKTSSATSHEPEGYIYIWISVTLQSPRHFSAILRYIVKLLSCI